MIGALAWCGRDGVFGFLKYAGGEGNVFVHRDDLAPGERLISGASYEFDIGDSNGRSRAINVRRVQPERVA